MQVPKRKSEEKIRKKLDYHITQTKHDKMCANLERLKKRQPTLSREVQRLAEMGDFSENAAYQIAKGKLRGLNWRILELEDFLKFSIIIKINKNNNTVQLGSVVTIEINNIKKEFTILGSNETSPKDNIISHNSPLGSALIGKKVGDNVTVFLEDKSIVYKILELK